MKIPLASELRIEATANHELVLDVYLCDIVTKIKSAASAGHLELRETCPCREHLQYLKKQLIPLGYKVHDMDVYILICW